MSVNVGIKGPAFGAPSPDKKSSRATGWIIFTIIALLLGGGFWYVFFGKKPRVVLTVPLGKQDFSEQNGMWSVGHGEVVVLGNGEVKLVNVPGRAVKWSAKIPASIAVDPSWRASVNSRFVRLHQWADELSRKRSSLKTPKETKDFNDEAAKYQAELAAVRAELSRPPAVAPPIVKGAAAKASPPALGAKKGKAEPEILKQASSPEMQLLEQRIKRRGESLKLLAASIQKKKAAAETDIQRSAVAEEERRQASLLLEQKTEQDELARLKGIPVQKPAEVAQVKTPEPEEEKEEIPISVSEKHLFASAVGSMVWVIDGEHMVAFDRVSGAVKSDVPLAGPSLKAWSHGEEIYVVAAAGTEARQITRIQPNAAPLSFYVPAGKVEEPFGSLGDAGIKPNVQQLRTEFTGPLLRADIKLIEEKVTTRDALKAESEKALAETAGNAVGGSTEELAAISKLIANDAQRLAGTTKEWLDGSTYEVTLRRPFDSAVPEWKGTVTGRVHLSSTPGYNLLAAGTKLMAFDPSNKKLWEATLGAPVPVRDEDEARATCLESGDRLYFADGAFLTAFEKASGNVLWRVPSIGIQKLQIDADGILYVHSRNLATESLTYAFDESFQDARPLTMKINPANGQIEWQVEKYHDLFVSGSIVYVLREAQNVVGSQGFDSAKAQEPRTMIFKLNAKNGEPAWVSYHPSRPRVVHAENKHVGLLFADQFQIIHSIAL